MRISQKPVPVGVLLDRETDRELKSWSDEEDRSKRRHAAVLLRKLTALRRTNLDDLRRLGLVGREEPVTA